MQATSTSERINLSNAKALRRSRELLKVTRNELADLLNVTYKAIEKYENGRVELDQEKIGNVLSALNLTWLEFKKVKRGKGLGTRKVKEKKVLSNPDRRSYQKIIIKEVKVLKSLRKIAGLSQDQASAVCGYARPCIGHIENGRIEVPIERLKHIVAAYGFEFHRFEELMKEEVLRDEIVQACLEKMIGLPEVKLKLVQSLLSNI